MINVNKYYVFTSKIRKYCNVYKYNPDLQFAICN